MLQQQIMCTCIPHPGLTLSCQLSYKGNAYRGNDPAVLMHPEKAIGGHVLRSNDIISHGSSSKAVASAPRQWHLLLWIDPGRPTGRLVLQVMA